MDFDLPRLLFACSGLARRFQIAEAAGTLFPFQLPGPAAVLVLVLGLGLVLIRRLLHPAPNGLSKGSKHDL